ncbi:MAG: ABC transporter permease [Carbonactinosporaceae bacterium]
MTARPGTRRPARLDIRRLGLLLAAPALAIAFAGVLTTITLLIAGDSPVLAYTLMLSYATEPDSVVFVINQGTTYYLSALAVAIGFKMKLFNIGVDGQYRLAAMLAASVGGAVALPAPLHLLVVVVTAVLVGAFWAGIAGLLKVTRGVSEVISTIMLNFIATGIVSWLLKPGRLAVQIQGSNNIGTRPIPESGHFPGIPVGGDTVFGFIVVAIACGIGYHVLVNRTRFGFDLRAAGESETAAVASGVDVRRMVVTTMLLSGAVAGLVGMPQLLGGSYTYALDFPAGLGFTGIAIALLGRNHAVGVAFGALLWAFLERSSEILQLYEIPREIVTIMQGTIVLSVVVAYELVRRYQLVRQRRQVGEQVGGAPTGEPREATV